MNREEMLKAMGLDDKPASQESGAVQVESQTMAGPAVPKSPNAMTLDRWTKRQGRQLHAKLAEEKNQTNQARPIHDLDATDLADLHLSVFDPNPELVTKESCSDKQKFTYFNELIDTPGFHDLRRSTVLDDAATDLAIERLAEGLVTLRKQKGDDGGDGDGPDGDDGFGPGRIAGNAVNQANQDVKDLNDAREGLGLGTGAGSGGQYDVKETLNLYKKLRQSSDLQKIVNLAGKYRLFGQSQQRRKVAHGYDDMVGVTIGNSIPRLTQSEFLALGLPELEDDITRRLLDNMAMIQDWHGNEPVAKGPMIIAIDESGSMTQGGSGGFNNIQHAKALALSFAYLARQQNRWCALVAWSGAHQRRSIVLAPGKWDHDALITWLSGFFDGGTVPPVGSMPTIYQEVGAPTGKTDIVYITDGTVYIDPTEIAGFNTWKKEVNAKVISLIVAASPGSMTLISNEVHVIKALGLNDATAAVLSI